MKIVITEDKRNMLFKTEFKNLFNKLTPTRTGQVGNISYIYFDEVIGDDIDKGLVYRPYDNHLLIYPDYFMSLRMFVSSDEELVDLIEEYFEELTEKPVRYSHIIHD
jgi:hypothetical protein